MSLHSYGNGLDCVSHPTACVTRLGWEGTTPLCRNQLQAQKPAGKRGDSRHHDPGVLGRVSGARCTLCWADRSSLRDWNPADELIVIYIPYQNFSEVVTKSNFRTIFVKCGTSPFGRNHSETRYQCRSQHGC
jgi:hypothetical protein